jgi:hypothetical protein
MRGVDYHFFEALSDEEAGKYLDEFLRVGRAGVRQSWWERLEADGLSAIAPFFAEVAERIRVVEVAPPDDVPGFIVEAMERDHRGFRDFDGDEDRAGALIAAFYFGAAFDRGYASLSWSVGRPDRAEERQPVITGFHTDADLPVLEVAENLLLRYDPAAISTAVATWDAVI